MSLFASTINEIILSYLNMRGRDLVRGLREPLNDKNGTGLVQHLYSHGLIYGLFEADYVAGKTSNLPAYIPARSFALAIMDIVPKLAEHATATGARSGASGAMSTNSASKTDEDILEPVRTAAEKLDPKVRAPLIAMIDASSKDTCVLRQNIENWFNCTMDRVSGWVQIPHSIFSVLDCTGPGRCAATAPYKIDIRHVARITLRYDSLDTPQRAETAV